MPNNDILPAKPDRNGIITSTMWAAIRPDGEVVGMVSNRQRAREWAAASKTQPAEHHLRVAKALVIVCVKRGKR